LEYGKIDTLLTEAMLSTEKQISKSYSDTYQWSPTLHKSIASLKYWKLKLREARGHLVSPSQLIRWSNIADIVHTISHPPVTMPMIKENLRLA
jgi:hypothetical protein